ncbi:MAG TPA: RimK family alpha-L-glutamate ligase [Rhodospirillaceae bacterium]|nr:RimK family alpha-L-glutamate ligase [Rhodospirillaceae bacterium]
MPMRCWIFFHADPHSDYPGAYAVRQFMETAARMEIELAVLKPQNFDLVVDKDSNWSAVYEGKQLEKPDFIISRTGSDTSYFMLAVLRHMEHQGIRIVNAPPGMEAAADKMLTQQILAAKNLPVPKTILAKFPVDVDFVEREIGFPAVVKPLRGNRGSGVMLCETRERFNDLASLIDLAASGSEFIFQEYIRASHGRDARLVVCFGEVIAAVERRSEGGLFKSNAEQNMTITPFDAPRDMQKLAIDTAGALQLDIAGIDLLFDENGYRILEANSAPSFKEIEAACNINIPEAVFRALEKQNPHSLNSFLSNYGFLYRGL